MSDCPECDTFLLPSGACKKCGWTPTPESASPRKVLPMYRAMPERKLERAPMTEEILAMLQRIKGDLAVAPPRVRPRAVETLKRCPECVNGRFVHAGVTFCRACYSRL